MAQTTKANVFFHQINRKKTILDLVVRKLDSVFFQRCRNAQKAMKLHI